MFVCVLQTNLYRSSFCAIGVHQALDIERAVHRGIKNRVGVALTGSVIGFLAHL